MKTIDHYQFQISHKRKSPEQVAAQWERQNQSSCREVASAFNKWKDSPDKEDIFQVIKLVGLHSTMVQRRVDSTEGAEHPVVLSTLEDYSVPCGHNTDLVIKVSQEYKRHLGEQGQSRDGFFELVKLNYNHLSKIKSFKGIGMGLEMLSHGVEERLLSSRDRHQLKSLIRKSHLLNFEYQQDLLDLQKNGEEEKLGSITSFYEEERILLKTKVRIYLERIVQNYPGDRTAKL
ncbi:MAG: hypothetical protein NXH75_12030 [Halobacteriovoraceae bacterium]|nr:hypothetical protein [Halobacteriovoraceae bacterium]